MVTGTTYVIVGAGLAGAKAAETLRAEGFDGSVVIIGAEGERPYERPPLSKEYLTGDEEKAAIYVHEDAWYAENGVELRLGAEAAAIHRSAHEVELAGGERVGYDKLLLATGASVRPLNVPGASAEGVRYLRTVADSERLRERLRTGGRTVVVGAGLIGLETAAAARAYGGDVTLVEPEPTPLYRVLGPELGEVFADVHRDRGVRLRLGVGAAEVRVADGRARAVVTSDGEILPADTVLVGVGVAPNAELAEACGLGIDDGILVDSTLRTSDPDIYAAGDVANAHNPMLGHPVRVEHWANALDGGCAAARSMLRQGVVYDNVPYFFSDQYDLGMEFSGHLEPGGYDDVVYRGDRDALEFIAFWLAGRRVVAAMNVNIWDVTDHLQALVRSGEPVDTGRLADRSTPLDQLLPRA